MSKYARMAVRLFKRRWFPDTDQDVSLQHFEREDILVLIDRRTCERRDREWTGFRNYLYGWDCGILAERSAPDYAVMLIDASHDMQSRLAREFSILTWIGTVPIENATGDNSPEMQKQIERFQNPAFAHSVWGRVAVENGKPIGLYGDNGEIVRQPIDKSWHEYSSEAAA